MGKKVIQFSQQIKRFPIARIQRFGDNVDLQLMRNPAIEDNLEEGFLRIGIDDLLYHADGLCQEEEYSAAIAVYERAIALIGNNEKWKTYFFPKIYKRLSYCNRKKKSIKEAVENGEQSIYWALRNSKFNPDSIEVKINLICCYMNLGVIYDERHQYDKALRYYQEAIAVFDDALLQDSSAKHHYINALISIGTAFYSNGEFLKAKEIFQFILDNFNFNTNDARYCYAVNHLNLINSQSGDENL